MKIFHTSDWHLGRSLYGRKRYEEFAAFLSWLRESLIERGAEVLLVAGDVFDTGSPSNRAQDLYYDFLASLRGTCCRQVIITAGNHDSPSFLDAPKSILRYLNVTVIGTMNEEEEIVEIKNAADETALIICAVPYLRDRDIRIAEAGESYDDKESKLIQGIKNHYDRVCALAQQRRDELLEPVPHAEGADCQEPVPIQTAELLEPVPILATGHLFAAGGTTQEGDGVRDLYVGSLGQIGAEAFPDCIDYLALGHLHRAQKVGGRENRRYCGSPLPMSFGEATQQKLLLEVDFSSGVALIEEVPIPVFQRLRQIRGDWDAIAAAIEDEKTEASWLEIIYEGEEIISNLQGRLAELIADSGLEILRVQNRRVIERALQRMHCDETLDQLREEEVFQRCLDMHEVCADQQDEMKLAFQEIIAELNEQGAP